MPLSIFKIALMIITLSLSFSPSTSAAAAVQIKAGDTVIYQARAKADGGVSSTSESIVIHDLGTGVHYTVVTYTNTIESGMGYNDYPLEVSPDGRVVFNVGSGTQIWDHGRTVDLLDGYNYQWNADGQLAFIGFADKKYDIYLWQDGELTSLGIPAAHPEIGTLAAFDRAADGRFLFFGWKSPTIYIWDNGAVTTIQPDILEEHGLILDARWSPDGRIAFIVAQDQNWNLYLWDGSTVTGAGIASPSLAWSTDGRLAYQQLPDIYVWKEGTTQSIGQGLHPRWSLDGRLAFTSENGDTVYVWDGDAVMTVGESSYTSLYADWNADGRLVVSNHDLYVWDNGTITRITNSPDVEEINPHWINLNGK